MGFEFEKELKNNCSSWIGVSSSSQAFVTSFFSPTQFKTPTSRTWRLNYESNSFSKKIIKRAGFKALRK